MLRLPWWLTGKESACQCRRYRFDPWSWKIPHAVEELSLCAIQKPCSRARESQLLGPRAPQQERTQGNEKVLHCDWRAAPLSTTRGKPVQPWRPSPDKIKIPWTVAHQAPPSWDSPGKNIGVGCHSLLQGIFPTHGSNPGPLHCRQILYHLSHQGGPK